MNYDDVIAEIERKTKTAIKRIIVVNAVACTIILAQMVATILSALE